jgi:hypothetical protein
VKPSESSKVRPSGIILSKRAVHEECVIDYAEEEDMESFMWKKQQHMDRVKVEAVGEKL